MVYNIVQDGNLVFNDVLSSYTVTSSGVNLLYDDDLVTEKFSVVSGTAILDYSVGTPVFVKNLKYYISDAGSTEASLSYGIDSYTTTSVESTSSGTYSFFDINCPVRYIRLQHTCSSGSSVKQLVIEGDSNDFLYFAGLADYAYQEYLNTPIGLISSSSQEILIQNDASVLKTAAVSVAPTVSGSERHFLLSDSRDGRFLPRKLIGHVQPTFLLLEDYSETFINSDLNFWDKVLGAKGYLYSDSGGLNIICTSYAGTARAGQAGPTGTSVGIVSKDSYSNSQSFTISVDVKITNMEFDDIANPNSLFFGVSSTWPIKDFVAGNAAPVDRTHFRNGKSLAATWFGAKAETSLYFGGARADGVYSEFLTDFRNLEGSFGGLTSFYDIDTFNANVLKGTVGNDGTSNATFRNLKLSYDHSAKFVRVFFDEVEIDSFHFSNEPLPEVFKIFIVYSGANTVNIVVKNFSIVSESVRVSETSSYTAITFSDADTSHTSLNLGDGRWGSATGAYSWISGLSPVEGDSISITFDENKDVYGIRLRSPSYVTISGTVYGNPKHYIGIAKLEFDTGDSRYIYMDDTPTPNIDGWDVRYLVTSSGTLESVQDTNQVDLSITYLDEKAALGPLDVLAISEIEFLSKDHRTVETATVISGTATSASWSRGRLYNCVPAGNDLHIRQEFSNLYDVSSVEPCDLLRYGVNYSLTNPIFLITSSEEQYHYAESMFKISGRGSATIVRASTSGGKVAHIWRKLNTRAAVKAFIISLNTNLNLDVYQGFPDKWKLQTLKEGGSPSTEADWSDIPPVSIKHGTAGEYKTYKNYLIANNDGEYYTSYINAYDSTGNVTLPSDLLLYENVYDFGRSHLGSFSSTADIYIELDESVQTEYVRLVIADGYTSTSRALAASGYSFKRFVTLADTAVSYYESPVFDTGYSINSERMFYELYNTANTSVLYRTSDIAPIKKLSETYEVWEDLGQPFAGLDYSIAFSATFCGVGVYNNTAYFGFSSYYFGEDVIYKYDLNTGEWSEGPDYPDEIDVSTHLDSNTWGNCVSIGDVLYFAGKSTSGSFSSYPIMKYLINEDSYGISGWKFSQILRQLVATNAGMVLVGTDEIFFVGSTGIVTVFKTVSEELTLDGHSSMPLHGYASRGHFVPAYGNGKIFVAGGFFYDSGGTAYSTTYLDIYDINSKEWSVASPAPHSLRRTWNIYYEGFVYVLPVYTGTSYYPYLKYSVAEDSWTVLTSLGYSHANYWSTVGGTSSGHTAPPTQYFLHDGYIYGFNGAYLTFLRFSVETPEWTSGNLAYSYDDWNSVDYLKVFDESEYFSQGRYVQYRIQFENSGTAYPVLRNTTVGAPLYIEDIVPGNTSSVFIKTALAVYLGRYFWYGGRYGTYKNAILSSRSEEDSAASCIGPVITDYELYKYEGIIYDSCYSYTTPCVIKNISDYVMFATNELVSYSGEFLSGSIYRAVSTEGVNWSTMLEVIPAGFEGTIDIKGSCDPFVYSISGQYNLFYTGIDVSDVKRVIRAVSSDGIIWSSPTLVVDILQVTETAGAAFAPAVVYYDPSNCYYMYYTGISTSGIYSIIKCSSPDLFSWASHEVVLTVNTRTTVGYAKPYVLYDGTIFKMWVINKDLEQINDVVEFYTSYNGLSWEFVSVVLTSSEDSEYDVDFVDRPCVLIDQEDVSFNYGNSVVHSNDIVDFSYYNATLESWDKAASGSSWYLEATLPSDSFKLGMNSSLWSTFNYTGTVNTTFDSSGLTLAITKAASRGGITSENNWNLLGDFSTTVVVDMNNYINYYRSKSAVGITVSISEAIKARCSVFFNGTSLILSSQYVSGINLKYIGWTDISEVSIDTRDSIVLLTVDRIDNCLYFYATVGNITYSIESISGTEWAPPANIEIEVETEQYNSLSAKLIGFSVDSGTLSTDIVSKERSSSTSFPQTALVVVDSLGVSIINYQDKTLWMRIGIGTNSVIQAAPIGVAATAGCIYINCTTELIVFDFTTDSIYKFTETGKYTGTRAINYRNSYCKMGPVDDSLQISSNVLTSISTAPENTINIVAIGTPLGLDLLKDTLEIKRSADTYTEVAYVKFSLSGALYWFSSNTSVGNFGLFYKESIYDLWSTIPDNFYKTGLIDKESVPYSLLVDSINCIGVSYYSGRDTIAIGTDYGIEIFNLWDFNKTYGELVETPTFFTDPEFNNYPGVSWEVLYSTYLPNIFIERSSEWSTVGTYSFKFYFGDNRTVLGDYVEIYQDIDLTNVDYILYDLKFYNGTSYKNEYTDKLEILVDGTVYNTHQYKGVSLDYRVVKDMIIDTTNLSETVRVVFRLSATTTYSNNTEKAYYIDNLRTNSVVYEHPVFGADSTGPSVVNSVVLFQTPSTNKAVFTTVAGIGVIDMDSNTLDSFEFGTTLSSGTEITKVNIVT
jgi:hypothetical protein